MNNEESLTKITRGSFPIHPIIIAAYSILFLYSNNYSELDLAQTYVPLFGCILLCVISWAVADRFARNKHKSALIASIFTILFISYSFFGQIIDATICHGKQLFGLFGYNKLTIAFLGVLFCLVTFVIIKAKHRFAGVSHYLNVVSVLLVIWTLLSIVVKTFEYKKIQDTTQGNNQPTSESLTTKSERPLPDIYYIILDAYTSSSILKNDLGFDNREIEDFLRSRGFKIAEKSHSNYATTTTSLSSSLNMKYHAAIGTQPDNNARIRTRYFFNLVRNNAVWNFLESRGYKIIVMSSYFMSDYTYKTPKIYNWSRQLFSEKVLGVFTVFVLQNTPISAILRPIQANHRLDINYSFNKLKAAINVPGPKFVFSHILSPHPPYVFGPNGEAVSYVKDPMQAYVGQVRYTNKMLKPCVDAILAKSKSNVVVIIQGDHGLFPVKWDLGDDRIVNQRMHIFNALYSKECDTCYYDSITPVNTFGRILGFYFGRAFVTLPDSSYAFDTAYVTSYSNMVNVTNRLKN